MPPWNSPGLPQPGAPSAFHGTPSEKVVEDVYRNLLGRDADPAGLATWVSVYQSTGSTQAVINGIIGSDEYKSREVQHLYQQILGRTASAGEVNFWVTGLKSGLSETQVMIAFLNSAEFNAGKDDTAFVQSLYTLFLGRSGEPAAVQGWVSLMNSPGHSRQDVINGILRSEEHAKFVVNTYYQYYLGRPADAAGLATWVTRLTSGAASEADIARAILSSAEFAGMSR